MIRRPVSIAVAVALAAMFCAPGCAGRPGPVASDHAAKPESAAWPRQEMQALLARLKSPDPLVRVGAIRALVRLNYELALAERTAADERPAAGAPLIATGRAGAEPARVYVLDPATGKPIVVRPRQGGRLEVWPLWVDDVVPALVDRAVDVDPRVRYAVVWALADLDNPSEAVLHTVKCARNDKDRWVRDAAALAYVELTRPEESPEQARTAPRTLEEKILWIIAAGRNKPQEVAKFGPEALPVMLKIVKDT